MPFLTDLIHLDPLDGDPVSPEEGQIWYERNTRQFKLYKDGVVETFVQSEDLKLHTENTDNPHAVTATQVGLDRLTNDTQLKRGAADFNVFPSKTSPSLADLLLVEDSTGIPLLSKAKVQVGTLPFDKYESNTDSTTTTTTTSITDVVVTDMDTTPPAMGVYLVFFTGSAEISINNATLFLSIYTEAVQVASSERRILRGNQPLSAPFTCVAVVSFSGPPGSITGRWRVTGGTGTMYQRCLTLIKVG